MGRFVVYIAMSLDGYIAEKSGDVHWLEAFEKDDYGYGDFLGSIGSILMGRVTCEQVLSHGSWPYGDIPSLVWSSRTIEKLPGSALQWTQNLEEAVSWLKDQAGEKDTWVLGGARTIQTFLKAGMIDRMDLFVVPVLLGEGKRLFESHPVEPQMLRLEGAQPYANGVVHLTFKWR